MFLLHVLLPDENFHKRRNLHFTHKYKTLLNILNQVIFFFNYYCIFCVRFFSYFAFLDYTLKLNEIKIQQHRAFKEREEMKI